MAVKLKPAAKLIITLLLAGGAYAGYTIYLDRTKVAPSEPAPSVTPTGSTSAPTADGPARARGVYRIALSEWPGHMPLIIGNGGLTTQPGSAAEKLGIKLEVVFIEDPVKKNNALQQGSVDFVWQTVDEMPINMGGYKKAQVDVRAFVQVDWSRGGDACVASEQVKTVEDILGKKSAMMMFSPDHTVFEFMINNSRLTPEQIQQVRKDTQFSMDDFTFGRVLFTQNKVDVACLWEPDVTLALRGRPGSHRLFSTGDATELVADVLLAQQRLITSERATVEKVAKVWFAGAEQAERDKPAAARFVTSVVPRFRDELKYEGTLQAFEWVKWTNISDNARFFGLDGAPPAFDRVYNQADRIWGNYPEAQITDRFAPQGLRDPTIIARIWEEEGKKKQEVKADFDPQVAKTGRALFTKPVTINFNTGKSDLDPESMHILNTQVLPQLQMAAGMYVRVEGNTDDVGNPQSNQMLSERRAKGVADFLVSKGIPAARVSSKGNGQTNPQASNKTDDGRAANRRTDILFISGEDH